MRRRRSTYEPTLGEQVRFILTLSTMAVALGAATVAGIILWGAW